MGSLKTPENKILFKQDEILKTISMLLRATVSTNNLFPVGRVSYPAIVISFSFVGKESRPTISFTDQYEVI